MEFQSSLFILSLSVTQVSRADLVDLAHKSQLACTNSDNAGRQSI